jgi:hypothetical protein
LFLGCDNCDRTEWFGECFFRISFDKGFEECGFAYTWWADDCDEAGRWFFGDAVYLRYVEALFFDLAVLG